MLRMSRDQVAPMKTPSIWKASTPLIAVQRRPGQVAQRRLRGRPRLS